MAFRESDSDQCKETIVLSKGGEATGKHSSYFNVQMSSSSKISEISFDDVKEWKKINTFISVERVDVVIVPTQMHGNTKWL